MPRYDAYQIAQLAKSAGFTNRDELVLATAIALAESSGETTAVSPSGCCYGLWQIHAEVWGYSPAHLRNPVNNARAARRVFKEQGWRAWEVYTNGAYRRHLEAATEALVIGGGSIVGDAAGVLGELVTDPGDVVDAASNIGGAAAARLRGIFDLDEVGRTALLVGTAMVLTVVGGAVFSMGLWRVTGARERVDQILGDVQTATGAAGLAAKGL